MLRPLDLEALRDAYATAKPFPFIKIENFLEPQAAELIAASFPSFEVALGKGQTFKTVNERKKIQITRSELFPSPIISLNEALASPGFLRDLSYITGIKSILADPELTGGGMHITGPGGRLDVHVDFNYIEDRKLYRRANLLLYLNRTWDESWGGQIQLWDREVKRCEAAFAPIFNRCIVFETSQISYHGVTPVTEAAPIPRQSFATYYYTKEAPDYWDGIVHGTIFKARPDERLRGLFLMPMETFSEKIKGRIHKIKDHVKRLK
jgi:Rps23 Pro-64 3,4-dihydroxylase Tpa1-like proline 4-hydroxylase